MTKNFHIYEIHERGQNTARNAVRKIMNERGMPIAKLAGLIRVATATIKKWQNGDTDLSVTTLQRLADVLEYDLVITFVDKRPSPAITVSSTITVLDLPAMTTEQFAAFREAWMAAISTPATATDMCGKGGCTNPERSPHPCPYQEDVNGDDRPCTCCVTCSNNCAADI